VLGFLATILGSSIAPFNSESLDIEKLSSRVDQVARREGGAPNMLSMSHDDTSRLLSALRQGAVANNNGQR